MCRVLKMAHLQRLKIIYVFKQGVLTDMAGKVLVVDDEKMIVKGIKFSLVQDYSVVDCAYDGEEALNMARNNDYDIILLDIMLPKMNGLEVCQQIREFSNVPIIMLTAKSDESSELNGFECGADEYIAKPFSPKILTARVDALIRRSYSIDSSEVTDVGGIIIDKAAHIVKIDGQEIDLSFKEFELLTYFVDNKGLALSREKILNNVWNYDYFGDARTIDTHVKKLRKKLGDKGDYIKTIWGMGYKFEI